MQFFLILHLKFFVQRINDDPKESENNANYMKLKGSAIVQSMYVKVDFYSKSRHREDLAKISWFMQNNIKNQKTKFFYESRSNCLTVH